MTNRYKSFLWLIIIILAVMLSTTCSGTVTETEVAEPAIPAATEAPAEESANSVVSEAAIEPTKPVEVIISVPEDYELRSIQFDSLSQEVIDGMQVFVGTGTIVNDVGEQLLVTTTGSSEASVTNYLATTKFYFKIEDKEQPIEFPPLMQYSEQMPMSELLKEVAKERVEIELEVPTELKDKYSRGWLLVIVDPEIGQNQYHRYSIKDPTNDQAFVEITCQEGDVEGTLYWQDDRFLSGGTMADNPLRLSGEGGEQFDLFIRGLKRESNIYQLIGTWDYDYIEAVPVALPILEGNPQDWLPPAEQIPTELYLYDSHSVSNADVAEQFEDTAQHEARLEDFGRLLGYEEYYLNENICADDAVFSYTYVETILMNDEPGAAQYINWLEDDERAWIEDVYGTEENFKYDGGLGDASFYSYGTMLSDECDASINLFLVRIHFRRYNVVGFVRVEARADHISEDEIFDTAFKLASSIDANLIEAGK